MLLLFTLIISFISATLVLYTITKKNVKAKIKKASVPPSFWDDYNHCMQSIYKMNEADCGRVENMIDNIMYQYVEELDYSFYISILSNLVEAYNNKVKSFLLTNLN